jgi:ribosomal protein L37E
MIWCLVVAGAAGVLLVFTQSWDVGGRLMASGVFAAIAMGFLSRFSVWIDKPQVRAAGLLGMAWSIGEFVLVLLAIWFPGSLFYGSRLDEKLWLTALWFGLTGFMAVFCLKGIAVPKTRRGAILGVVLAVAEFLLLVGATWFKYNDWDDWDVVMQISVALAAYGAVSCIALVGWGASPARWWRWIGVGACVIGFALVLGNLSPVGDYPYQIIWASSVAAVVAHLNIVLMAPLREGQGWVAPFTVGAAVVTALLLDAAAWEGSQATTLHLQLAGAAGIVTACGTLALAVLARLNRTVDFDPVVSLPSQIHLTCPRCEKKQDLAIGESACVSCGLRIFTRIEDPRCRKCGYPLYKLEGDRCPECGEPLAAAGTGALA